MQHIVTNSSKENKAICYDFFEALHNKGNIDIIDKYVHQHVVSHDPFPGQAPGAQGLKDTMKLFRAAFPDLHVTFEDMIAEGEKVMTKFNVKGSHKGEFMGKAGTGKEISYKEVIILRFRNGKIVEHWAVADTLSLMQQIGAINS